MAKRRVIVIGGGAAGMMAAIWAARGGCNVTLLEKNEKLGKKLYITGKGRCNVTNACETEDFFRHVVNNGKFLYSAIYGFPPDQLMSFLKENGCPVIIERGQRVFPASGHASDVTKALAGALEKERVTVMLHTKVTGIARDRFGAVHGVYAGSKVMSADAVIVATGGLAYPSTGSTGDGYKFAQNCGHDLVAPLPSLVPFTVRESWCQMLQGLSIKNVSCRLLVDGKERYSGFGEMLFTHFGVSGPLILSASSYYAAALRQMTVGRGYEGRPQKARFSSVDRRGEGDSLDAVLELDLKPALSEEQLDRRLQRDFEEAGQKYFKNALDGLFPRSLIPVMLDLSGIDPNKKAGNVTKEERHNFGRLIKRWRIRLTGTRDFDEAVMTSGGVPVSQINPSTMESRLAKGLYFAGEVLDADALTGGFNLQIAFSTGKLAGESAAIG